MVSKIGSGVGRPGEWYQDSQSTDERALVASGSDLKKSKRVLRKSVELRDFSRYLVKYYILDCLAQVKRKKLKEAAYMGYEFIPLLPTNCRVQKE